MGFTVGECKIAPLETRRYRGQVDVVGHTVEMGGGSGGGMQDATSFQDGPSTKELKAWRPKHVVKYVEPTFAI
jgi:hypothetical protein